MILIKGGIMKLTSELVNRQKLVLIRLHGLHYRHAHVDDIYIFHQRLAEVTSTEGGTVLIRQVPLGFSSLHRVSKMVA